MQEISSTGSSAGANSGKSEDNQLSHSVVADENQSSCCVCHEAFEQWWDSENEEWMFR